MKPLFVYFTMHFLYIVLQLGKSATDFRNHFDQWCSAVVPC